MENNEIYGAGYRSVPDAVGGSVARRWWDANAIEYVEEHGSFLGDSDFCWGPEGLRESDIHLLGDVTGQRILEVGAGAAQCSRWLTGQGARSIATDISFAMLEHSREIDRRTESTVPVVQADARALPFPAHSFDTVFTSFGAIPFVPDASRIHREVARVLRPRGRWVFSVTHPLRWAFPDDPGVHGLTANRSYFDRRPYVEDDSSGEVLYTEYHRTVGDHIREVTAAGLRVLDVVEPDWPADNDEVWGGWGPVRGKLLPGTLVVATELS